MEEAGAMAYIEKSKLDLTGRGRVMPILDGRLYVAQPSHTAAIRAPEYDRMALCCMRLCHSGVRRRLLPSISRAYQQPDHTVDIGFVTARLDAQEHRWDAYHWLRTSGLVVAFAALTLSLTVR
jgi:hypothetical protein